MAADSAAVEMAVDVEPKVEVEPKEEVKGETVESESVNVEVEVEIEAQGNNEEQEVDVEGVEGEEERAEVFENGDGSADQTETEVVVEPAEDVVGEPQVVGEPELGGELEETDGKTDFISERRKRRRLEVFVGGLDKETTEEDLKVVFEKAGEVDGVRLMKNPQSGKCKGFAFVRYATAAQAKEATAMFKEVEIRGRVVGVLPSEENDTLFLGNINRSWTKDAVMEALAKYVGKVEEFTLMEDPQSEGMNRGFGFVEFTSHKEALKALQRLSLPDANFGHERSAKVAWAEPLSEPDEETMSQVKSVFVNGMPPLWEEEKAREFFAKFGEIEKIELARNMSSAKRKDFGFVHFKEREAALACIESVNNTEIVDGDLKMKVKVSLAKPQTKKGGVRGAVRGGFMAGGRAEGRGVRGGRGRFGDDFGPFPGRGPRGFEAGRGGRGFRGGRFGPGPFGFGGRGGGRGPVRDFGDESNSYSELLKVIREQDDKVDDIPANKAVPVKVEAPPAAAQENGDAPAEGADGVKREKEVIPADKYECIPCGFGSDVEADYNKHLRTKVHRIIQLLRSGEKQVNKTPLSLLHEYASRNKCEVTYDTKSEGGLSPYEITANLGAAATGANRAMKATAGGRAKNKAKQMAASAILEQLMRFVPESEFTRPGASRLREAGLIGARGRGRGFPGSFGGRGAYVPDEGYGGDRGFGYGASRAGFEGREFGGGARAVYRQQERLQYEGRGAGFAGGPPAAFERDIGARPPASARFAGGYEGGRRGYEEPYLEEGRAGYEVEYAPSARRVSLPPAYAVRAAAAPVPQQAARYEEPAPAYSTRYAGGSRYESMTGLSAVERQSSYTRSANAPSSASAPVQAHSSYSLPATGYVEDARVVIGSKRPYGTMEELPRYGESSRVVQRARVEEPQQPSSASMVGSQYRNSSSYYSEPTRAPAAAQRVQQYGGYTSSNVETRPSQQTSAWTLSSSAGGNSALQSSSQQPYSFDQPSPYVAAGAQTTTTPVGGGLYQTNTGYGVSYSVSGDYLSSSQTPSVPTYQSAYNSAAGATTQQTYGSVPSNQNYY